MSRSTGDGQVMAVMARVAAKNDVGESSITS